MSIVDSMLTVKLFALREASKIAIKKGLSRVALVGVERSN